MLRSAEVRTFRDSNSTEVFSFILSMSDFWGDAIVSVSPPRLSLIDHIVCEPSVTGVSSDRVMDGWPGRVQMSAYM